MSPACAPQQPLGPVPPRVLIVDDAQDDREMYALFLNAIGGCQVTQAATGREALQALAREQPDVVVLDARLPDVEGWEVCRLVRRSPESAGTAVLAVTALPLQSPEIDRLIEAGTDAVLLKPCAPETLLKEIQAHLHRSRTLRERGRNEIERAAQLRARSERLQQRATEVHRTTRELIRSAEHLTLTQRVKANYLELPGLSLTVTQAQRVWGFEASVCEQTLDLLAAEGFLIRAKDGQYRRRREIP